jgi:uncharacterized protein YprB with RNaseH-like and TPR domain
VQPCVCHADTRKLAKPDPAELARLRALLERLAPRAPASPARPAARPALPLTPVDTPHGTAWRRREEVEPLPAMVGVMKATTVPGTVFLDTETTGLAGGTGTYVFLVGLATWTGQRLEVTQYFLDDLGAEAAFLAAVRDAVAEARRLVTFNGRTFDLPLLETRYLLARAPWWGDALPHRDLYPVARALWRARVADCRLTTLEAAVLGLDRGDDLPGSEMPGLYFRYLRTQDRRALPRLFEHNRRDLVALAALAARADDLLDGPAPRHDPLECLGAARWLERREPARSARFYQVALGASLPAPVRLRAAWRLGWIWRRAGQTAEALRLWTDVLTEPHAAPLGLLVDRAKLEEHHARDPATALRLARLALARAEQGEGGPLLLVDGLRHRIRRLERRVGRPLPPGQTA